MTALLRKCVFSVFIINIIIIIIISSIISIIIIIKIAAQAKVGKTKLFINCCLKSTSTFAIDGKVKNAQLGEATYG